MWTLIVPLIILLFVLLIGVRNIEKFTTSTTQAPSVTSQTLTRDASGNVVDASGNIVLPAATTPEPSISLSLMDLLRVITSTSEQATATAIAATQQQQEQQQQVPTAAQLAEQIKPTLIDDLKMTLKQELQGSPYTRAAPVSDAYDCSDATMQGVEYTSSKSSLQDNSEYIRKDSIPCYGCTLPQ